MNSVTIMRELDNHLKRIYHPNCSDDFYDLIEYILAGDTWSHLIDPCRDKTSKLYACGNFYCTRLEGNDLLITDIHLLDIHGHDEIKLKPIIISQDTVYNLAFAFNFMRCNKVSEFTVTEAGQRYIVASPGMELITIDPDLGILYNDMIPLITVNTVNRMLEGSIQINYHRNSLNDTPTKESLDIFYSIFIQNLSRQDAMMRYREIQDWIYLNNNEILIINDIKITRKFSGFHMEPIKQNYPNFIFISFTLSMCSVLKFLQAWETHLQFCDTFTLVFLGHTLRFFEGEPLLSLCYTTDQKNMNPS